MKMTIKKMKEEITYLADISLHYSEIVDYLKFCGELNYSYLTRIYKEDNFNDVRDLLDYMYSIV